VYARGNDRRRIFGGDRDRREYLRLLGRIVERHAWLCLAYCLMDNHVHLLLETPEPNLDVGMRRFHGTYAQEFNERHGRSGHLFQGRYGAVRLKYPGQVPTAAAYIAANPVEAGLCADPADWPWSSHAAMCEATAPGWLSIARLLTYYDALGGDPWERHSLAVEERSRVAVSAAACAPNRSPSSPAPPPPSS
jgi:putative transposase